MVRAYYNEHDKSAAEWLRELIREGVITDGVVDERSIEDVVPAELAEFDRCHFFAGVGVWDYALTRAGWPDDRRVWTGSCPCQPFSAAGKGDGFADERHLWPAWFHLIEQCRPGVIFGEQVSSKDTLPWIDLVHADLEGALYTVAAADLCSPSVGAPHIRQRLYFVADAKRGTAERYGRELGESSRGMSGEKEQRERIRADVGNGGDSHELADDDGRGRGEYAECNGESERSRRQASCGNDLGRRGGISQLGDTDGERLQRLGTDDGTQGRENSQRPFGLPDGAIRTIDSILADTEGTEFSRDFAEEGRALGCGPTNGFWRDAEWIYCRDGKWRPVGTIESGAFEMADELAADLGCVRDQSSGKYTVSPLIKKGKGRVARLRGYGNAIVAEVATKWIESYLDK